jgi:broad specificity phosphatase PhoE
VTTSPPPASFPPELHPHLRHPASGETTLYLVRHGRTDSNVRGLLHGVTDVPLDPHGLRQAASIAERLRRDVAPDVLLSSPLSRAFTTARIIGERIGLRPVVVPGLIEMDFGALEGATLERIVEEHPDLARRLLDGDEEDLAWPDGESRFGFNGRVLAVFQRILEDYASHRVVVVAHGGVIGTFLAQIQGLSPNDPAIYDLMNCSLTHLHVTPEHTELHCRNDVIHLDGLSELDDGLSDAADRQA